MKKILLLLQIILSVFWVDSCSADNDVADLKEIFNFPPDSPYVLRFNENDNFRILQLTDLHFDQSIFGIEIQNNIRRLIALTNPDLVIITGDIVSGQPATYRWLSFASFLGQLGTPYLIALGNHDSQYLLTRPELYKMIRTYPNCLNKQHLDSEAYMEGDMQIPIYENQSDKTAALIYLFDSNDYNSPEKQLGMRPAQTEWFKKKSRAFNQNNDIETIPTLVFMHVPLPTYREAANNRKDGYIGSRGEKEYIGLDGNGFFEALKGAGNVCGVFCGHDHFNDYVHVYEGIALCYGRKSGSHNTYQRYPSGGRVIDLHAGEKGFYTYIQECDGKQFNHYLYIPKMDNETP